MNLFHVYIDAYVFGASSYKPLEIKDYHSD